MIKNPTESKIMIKIVEWMISETNNAEYHKCLKEILKGLKGKRWMETENNPRVKSIVLFGQNLFPFEMRYYKEMVKLL